MELPALRLQVGPQAGHALPLRRVQSGRVFGRSLRARQRAPPQRNSVRLPAGEETKCHLSISCHTATRLVIFCCEVLVMGSFALVDW